MSLRNIIIGMLVLVMLAAGVFVGYTWWANRNEAPPSTEEEVSLGADALGDIPDNTESDFNMGPDVEGDEAPLVDAEPGETAPLMGEDDAPLVDLSEPATDDPQEIIPTEAGSTRAIDDSGSRPERQPETTDSSRPEETTSETPVTTTAVSETSSVPTAPVESPPTVASTTTPPESTTTAPVSTVGVTEETPPPPAGNYSVRTIVPVLESQLAAARAAAKRLGVQLQEQKTGQPQQLQAYRVSVGYFRSKQDATSWAKTNFRPKKIAYYVYPAQGMYSIQVGVYTHPQNVDKKMRELHQKFPGWRLPIRSERATIQKSSYHLSITKIPEKLARKLQTALVRVGIQAELTGL